VRKLRALSSAQPAVPICNPWRRPGLDPGPCQHQCLSSPRRAAPRG
jgi:hypothetical protein